MRRLLSFACVGLLLLGSDWLLDRADWPVARVHAAATFLTSNAAKSVNTTSVSVTIDSSGASLVTIHVSSTDNQTPTENKSNSVSCLTFRDAGGGYAHKICYITAGTMGASHTFTYTAAFPSICVQAFAGTKTTSVFDVQNGSGTASTGSITPSANNAVVVDSATSSFNTSNPDSGTLSQSIAADGNAIGIHCGREIQTTATARNVTWDGGAATYASAIASFLEQTAQSHGLLNRGVGN